MCTGALLLTCPADWPAGRFPPQGEVDVFMRRIVGVQLGVPHESGRKCRPVGADVAAGRIRNHRKVGQVPPRQEDGFLGAFRGQAPSPHIRVEPVGEVQSLPFMDDSVRDAGEPDDPARFSVRLDCSHTKTVNLPVLQHFAELQG